MQLEQFRENDLGTTCIWIPRFGNGPESRTRLTYVRFAEQAFYKSAQQIDELEFSNEHLQQGREVQTSVGLWYLSVEAYINSILRVACLLTNRSFDELKVKDFGPRIKVLFEILGIDRMPFYTGTFQKLDEFKRYRNELFHDRSNDQPLVFHRTAFSGNPMNANQVDVMQAAVIAVQTYRSFRYVIPGLDLMPKVVVEKEQSFFHASIDVLYDEILRPHFEESLIKHSLVSSVDLGIDVQLLAESDIFNGADIQVLIKAIPDERFKFNGSHESSRIGQRLLQRFKEPVTFDAANCFMLANYYRS